MIAHWGGGEMASADGMRFVIPVSTIHAAYNPRYFGRQRGSTLYSWMTDALRPDLGAGSLWRRSRAGGARRGRWCPERRIYSPPCRAGYSRPESDASGRSRTMSTKQGVAAGTSIVAAVVLVTVGVLQFFQGWNTSTSST